MKGSNSKFDAAALDYDSQFTNSSIGKLQRSCVFDWLQRSSVLSTPKNIFEINCGTGADAEQLSKQGHAVIATDGSANMIATAKLKRNHNIEFYQLQFSELVSDKNIEQSDILFSNFGGLNCLNNEALARLIQQIGAIQTKGNYLIAVLMAKHCFMEDLYHLIKMNWSKINRRNTSEGLSVEVNGTTVPTFYHSPKEVKKMLQLNYNIRLLKPVAFLLPPSYLEPFFVRHPKILQALGYVDKILRNFSFLSAYSDHYIVIAERK